MPYNSATGYVGMDFFHLVIAEIDAQRSEVYWLPYLKTQVYS